MSYIAHIRESDGGIQTIEDHLLEVKKLAESFGEKIGIKHLTGLAGMLHDLGKCTNQFKDYILEAVNNPDAPPKRGSVDHSTAGGKLIFELFHNQKDPYQVILSEIIGNAIISHHSYLQDFLNPDLESPFLKRVRDKELEEFKDSEEYFYKHVMSRADFLDYVEKASTELKEFLSCETPENHAKQLMFLTKFIFSSLIDADRTNSRIFDENKIEITENKHGLFRDFYEKILTQIQFFQEQENANTPINLLRVDMSDQCDRFAEKPSGIYTLSIPTGGGKTLASLRYALKHALQKGKQRIIFVVPYTTIIEQNAEEVRRILEDEWNILEHHSNIIEDRNDDDEYLDGILSSKQRWKLAKDNWDSPIIFTTMVQFLNVFYAKGSRNIRRLHNVSKSVVIFDEVQKVPIPCISLFNQALNFLKTYSDSSIVLCTATQPALDFVQHKLEVSTDAEMINNLNQVIESFKRVEIVDKATDETLNNEQLTYFIEEKMGEVQSVLVILNTKSVVKDLYQRLLDCESEYEIYHLSTSMCAAHRSQVLEEVRLGLFDGRKIICVSTQLIEAGVDVSFDCVIRSLAGLDSIAQAAGRCNRHGEKKIGYVYVIDHVEENLQRLEEIRVGKEAARKILIDLKRDQRAHGGQILSAQAMTRYFHEYYTELQSDLNYFIPTLKKEMIELLTSDRGSSSYFQAYISKHQSAPQLYLVNSYYTAAENFQVIANMTTSVLVPYKEGKEIIAELNSNNSIDDLTKLLRKAQQFTVNVYKNELDVLANCGGLVSLFDGKILALKEGAYHEQFGVNSENDSAFELNLF